MAFYQYRTHDADGGDLGEIHLAVLVDVGEKIFMRPGRRLRVASLVPVEEEDSPYVGLMMVEAAYRLDSCTLTARLSEPDKSVLEVVEHRFERHAVRVSRTFPAMTVDISGAELDAHDLRPA